MPCLARLALGFAVALGAAACAARMKEFPLEPAVQDGLGRGPPIHVVHFVPKPLGLVRQNVVRERTDLYDVPGIDDPVAEVERALLDALRAELGLSNLRPAGRPLWSERTERRGVTWERASPHAPMTSLPTEWGPEDLLLELETLEWHVAAAWPPLVSSRFTLVLWLKARLLRLSDWTVLSRAFCRQTHGPRDGSELAADDYRLLKDLRTELARACAAELAGLLTGRTERSRWDGTLRPRGTSNERTLVDEPRRVLRGAAVPRPPTPESRAGP